MPLHCHRKTKKADGHPADPYNTEEIRSIFAESSVSINYIIERDGTVRCFIPENRAAWHAGRGEWGDAKYTNAMNKYSIGIETRLSARETTCSGT